MPVANIGFVDTAIELVDDAEKQGVRLRILGSLAFRLHCSENIELFDKMQRDLTDVDFAAAHDQRKAIETYLEGLGYEMDRDIQAATEGTRWFFLHPETGLGVDVFFDELFFCHRIPFKGRLELDFPTIPLADLMLEKMQIVEINPKDIKDALVLLLEHPIGSGDREFDRRQLHRRSARRRLGLLLHGDDESREAENARPGVRGPRRPAVEDRARACRRSSRS